MATVVVAIGAALWFALQGPDTRAGAIAGALSAIASTTAALTALHLSREALARTDQQLAHARLVTVLSRCPLLLPVHQSVAFPESSGRLAAHPPTEERFRLSPPEVGSYAFVSDTTNTFLIPMENAGEGPALQVFGTLWHHSGRRGDLVGPTVISAGSVAIYTARLLPEVHDLPPGFQRAIPAGHERQDFYWLESTCVDVFANPLAGQAFFDTRGLGAWHVANSLDQVTNAAQRAKLVRRGAVDDQM